MRTPVLQCCSSLLSIEEAFLHIPRGIFTFSSGRLVCQIISGGTFDDVTEYSKLFSSWGEVGANFVGWGSLGMGELYEWSEIPECSWFLKLFLTVFAFKSRDVVKVPCIWLYVRLISSGTMALTPGCADGGWQTAVALKGVFVARWTCLWNFPMLAACHYSHTSLQVLSGLISLIVNRSFTNYTFNLIMSPCFWRKA